MAVSDNFMVPDTHQVYNKIDTLVESWHERISLVEEVAEEQLSYDKQIVLAQCLENTRQAIHAINESTDAGATDGFKHFALDLVTAINVQAIAA